MTASVGAARGLRVAVGFACGAGVGGGFVVAAMLVLVVVSSDAAASLGRMIAGGNGGLFALLGVAVVGSFGLVGASLSAREDGECSR